MVQDVHSNIILINIHYTQYLNLFKLNCKQKQGQNFTVHVHALFCTLLVFWMLS